MVKKHKKIASKKRYPDFFKYVFLCLWDKDLDPEKISKALRIEPDDTCRRGVVRNKCGEVIYDRSGKRYFRPVGKWILEAHVHDNSGIITRIENILEQIRPKKKILRQILKNCKADLYIAVQPHKDLCTIVYNLPGNLLNEFTSLGINIRFAVDIPQECEKFWRRVEKLHKEGKFPKMLSKKSKSATL